MEEKLFAEVFPCSEFGYIADMNKRLAVVIDVFRATSTMVTALANGCQSIIPVVTIEEALEARLQHTGALLGGERKALRIEGFDLGNSPFDYVPEKIGGKKIVMTTTNGTRAIKSVENAKHVWMASFLNIESIVHAIFRKLEKEKDIEGIVIVCAGTENRFDIPDTICSGMIVDKLGSDIKSNDLGRAAQMLYNISKNDLPKVLENSEHGQRLISLGLNKDLAYCSTLNILPIVPKLYKGEVVWKTDN